MSKKITINISLSKSQAEDVISEINEEEVNFTDEGWQELAKKPIELNYWELKKSVRNNDNNPTEFFGELLFACMAKVGKDMEPQEEEPKTSPEEFFKKLEELVNSTHK